MTAPLVTRLIRQYFDPDQPRDEAGRWTDTGTGAAGDRATLPLVGIPNDKLAPIADRLMRGAKFDSDIPPDLRPAAQAYLQQAVVDNPIDAKEIGV